MGQSSIVPFDTDGTPILFGPGQDRNVLHPALRGRPGRRRRTAPSGARPQRIETLTLPTARARASMPRVGWSPSQCAGRPAGGSGQRRPVHPRHRGDVVRLARPGTVPTGLHHPEQPGCRARPTRVRGRRRTRRRPAGRPAPAADLVGFGAWGDAYRVGTDGLVVLAPGGALSVETEGRILGGLGDAVMVARPPRWHHPDPDDAVQRVSFVDGVASIEDVPSAALSIRHLALGDRSFTATVLVEPGPVYRILVPTPPAPSCSRSTRPPVRRSTSRSTASASALSATPDLLIGLANLATGEIRRYAAPQLAGTGSPSTSSTSASNEWNP